MSAFGSFPRRFRLPWRSPERIRSEVDEEIAFHLDMRTEELVAAGMDPERAWAQAREEFGGVERAGEVLRGADESIEERRRRVERLQGLGMDLRFAFRRMRRAPGFTAAVMLTFALGIGANATMFGIVDRLLLRPPAHIAHPGDVVRLTVDRFNHYTGTRATTAVVSYPDLQQWARGRSFSSVAAVSGGGAREFTVGRGADALQLRFEQASGNVFSLLGVRAALGRFFGPDEDAAGAPGVAVLGYGAWKRIYGGDPAVIGRTLDFGYGTFTIVGVAPEGFTGVDLAPVDVWVPLRTVGALMSPGCWDQRNCNWIRVVARLAPGVPAATAEAEATTLYRAGWADYQEPDLIDPTARVVAAPLIAARGPDPSSESRVALWLAGISLLVLLIACANVANLLLARAIRQRREVGIRLALGSSRARVLGQVLLESLLLSLLGGLAALLFARWGGVLIRRILLPDVAWSGTGTGTRTVGVVLVLTVLAGITAGAIPASQAGRSDVSETLKSGARTSSGRISRTRGALTVLQAAFSVLLLVGAGLFVRSLHRVNALDLGLDPDGVLVVNPDFDRSLPEQRRHQFYEEAVRRLPALPGVEAVTEDVSIPFWSSTIVDLYVPGKDSLPTLPSGPPIRHETGPDYFRVLDLALRRGRGFRPGEGEAAAPVVIVNETMAHTLWPGRDALGKCIVIGGYPATPDRGKNEVCSEVVGVVEDARISHLLPEQVMQYYTPLQKDQSGWALLVRVKGDEAAAIPQVLRALLALEPWLRSAHIQPLRELIDPQARSWKLGAAMFTAFGLLALLVAGVGLYGVLAFSVAQRSFELGVRSALGASRERLMGLVLGQAVTLLALGVALGLLAAFVTAPKVKDLLYETSPHDPVILGGVVAVLLAVGLLAAWLPARRATRVDPSIALRVE
jgi:predicted permease